VTISLFEFIDMSFALAATSQRESHRPLHTFIMHKFTIEKATMAQAPSLRLDESARQEHRPLKKRPLAHCNAVPNSTITLRRNKKLKTANESPFESMHPELFCQVLSFVGTTSASLVTLSEVSKYMNNTMRAIGNVMLPRAQANFRVLLEPKSPMESCTSIFLRHARTCSRVLNTLTELRKILSQPDAHVAEMEKAMDMAMRLLEVAPSLSVSIERQILSTCGKCGGKAFKCSKYVLLHGLSQPTNGVSPSALQERQAKDASNQERLDKAQLIMQTVVFRNLQLSKQSPSSPMQYQAIVKNVSSMGCV
jgi:uncharacterized protein YuzB (UPF0349 family)